MRNGENTGNLKKKKHNIVPSRELVLEEAIDLSVWLHVSSGGGCGGGGGGGSGGGSGDGGDNTTT